MNLKGVLPKLVGMKSGQTSKDRLQLDGSVINGKNNEDIKPLVVKHQNEISMICMKFVHCGLVLRNIIRENPI